MPKSIKKLMKCSDRFSIDFSMIFGRFWEAFGVSNRCQNQWKHVWKKIINFWKVWGAIWASKSMPKSMKKCLKKLIDFWKAFSWKMEPKWRPRGPRMETKMEEFRGHFATPSQKPSRGGFWMDLGRILRGFWRDLGALGGPNGYENRYISKEIQVLPPRIPQGGLWVGFWEGFGCFGEGFGRF